MSTKNVPKINVEKKKSQSVFHDSNHMINFKAKKKKLVTVLKKYKSDYIWTVQKYTSKN